MNIWRRMVFLFGEAKAAVKDAIGSAATGGNSDVASVAAKTAKVADKMLEKNLAKLLGE